jgi:hypothetical protein
VSVVERRRLPTGLNLVVLHADAVGAFIGPFVLTLGTLVLAFGLPVLVRRVHDIEDGDEAICIGLFPESGLDEALGLAIGPEAHALKDAADGGWRNADFGGDLLAGRALAAGGSDEGQPGQRPHYGDGYYGAYLRDPDGNKLHVVFSGDIAGQD